MEGAPARLFEASHVAPGASRARREHRPDACRANDASRRCRRRRLGRLLDQIPDDDMLDVIGGDGAYDTKPGHAAIAARGATPSIPPREGAVHWPGNTSGAMWRNGAIDAIADSAAANGRPTAATIGARSRRTRCIASRRSRVTACGHDASNRRQTRLLSVWAY